MFFGVGFTSRPQLAAPSFISLYRDRDGEAPCDVAVGLRSDLLRRRPDVRMAERQLAAATANIGVAPNNPMANKKSKIKLVELIKLLIKCFLDLLITVAAKKESDRLRAKLKALVNDKW